MMIPLTDDTVSLGKGQWSDYLYKGTWRGKSRTIKLSGIVTALFARLLPFLLVEPGSPGRRTVAILVAKWQVKRTH